MTYFTVSLDSIHSLSQLLSFVGSMCGEAAHGADDSIISTLWMGADSRTLLVGMVSTLHFLIKTTIILS
jgi:hypothetical protein